MQTLENDRFAVGMIHESNVSPKATEGRFWKSVPVSEVLEILGGDVEAFKGGPKRTAIVACGGGIGDTLRITPLIRVLHKLGYLVDVMLYADHPETARLIEGTAEIRTVFASARDCAFQELRHRGPDILGPTEGRSI